jgi:hypothetical protein
MRNLKVQRIKVETRVHDFMKDNHYEVVVRFTVGSSFIELYANGLEIKVSPRFDGDPDPTKIEFKTTHQYRVMTYLGFKTKTGINYTWGAGSPHEIKVQFWKSKIWNIQFMGKYKGEIDYLWRGEGNPELEQERKPVLGW